MIILIIYLVGVLINCYFAICTLKDEYNAGDVITIGDVLGWIMICIISWIFLLLALLAWLCIHIGIIINKPLLKKHK